MPLTLWALALRVRVALRTLIAGPRFRGLRVVDGGLTNNTPCFSDGARRQIVLRLEHVPYDWRAVTVCARSVGACATRAARAPSHSVAACAALAPLTPLGSLAWGVGLGRWLAVTAESLPIHRQPSLSPVLSNPSPRPPFLSVAHLMVARIRAQVPLDPCIEALALNGALMMARFLEGRDMGAAISWDGDGGRGIFGDLLRAPAAWWQERRRPIIATLATALLLLRLSRVPSRLAAARSPVRRTRLLMMALGVLTAYTWRRSSGGGGGGGIGGGGVRRNSTTSRSSSTHGSSLDLSIMRTDSSANLARLL